jgi:hypothetical protein
MQKRQTSAGLKESTGSAWRTREATKASPDKISKTSSHKSVGSGQAGGEALQLKRKCWTQRQRRSTKVYPPAVFGGGGVTQTSIRYTYGPYGLYGIHTAYTVYTVTGNIEVVSTRLGTSLHTLVCRVLGLVPILASLCRQPSRLR